MGLNPYQQYTKKKPLDIDMTKLNLNLGQGVPMPGQGAGFAPAVASVRVSTPAAAVPARQQPTTFESPFKSTQRRAAPVILPHMSTGAQWAVHESASNVRDVAAPWAPSKNGSLADVLKLGPIPGGSSAPLGIGPGDSYQVPGVGAQQGAFYSAPQQKQTAAGTPDQSLNYGYEDRRATWYPQLNAQQLARAPWLNAGNDSAFRRALGAGFTADELTDATPWTEGQRFTAAGAPISLGQARLEGSVAPGYKPPAQAAQQDQGASNPYAGLQSALAGPNPYGPAYQQAYVTQGQGELRRAYASALDQARRDAAARGLSQAGMSGFEQDAILRASLAQAEGDARLRREADLGLVDKQADYGLRQGAGLDAFSLAKAGGVQGAGQFALSHALAQALGLGGLANDTRRLDLAAEEQRQTLPGRAESIQVGNEATRAATERIRQMTPAEVAQAQAQAQEAASRARVTGATEQDAVMRSGQQIQAGNIANEQAQVNLAQDRQMSPLQKAQALQQLAAAAINYQKLQAEMAQYEASLERAKRREEMGLELTEADLAQLRFDRSPQGQALGFFKGILPGVGTAAGAFAGTEAGGSAIAKLLAGLGKGGAGGGTMLDMGAFGGLG